MLTNVGPTVLAVHDRSSVIQALNSLEVAFCDEPAVAAVLKKAASEIAEIAAAPVIARLARAAHGNANDTALALARATGASVAADSDGRGFTAVKRDGTRKTFRDGSWTS